MDKLRLLRVEEKNEEGEVIKEDVVMVPEKVLPPPRPLNRQEKRAHLSRLRKKIKQRKRNMKLRNARLEAERSKKELEEDPTNESTD